MGKFIKNKRLGIKITNPNNAKERADNMRERLRQKLIKKQYKIKFDLYKNGMTSKILI